MKLPIYTKYLFLVLAITALFLSCGSGKKHSPDVKNGILDLKNWSFEENGSVELNGEWKFLRNEFSAPESIFDTGSPVVIVPGGWNNQPEMDNPASGYATYRLKIYLDNPADSLALEIKNISTAYSLYVNGVSAAKNGIPAENKETAVPFWIPVIAEIPDGESTLDILIHVSNYRFRNGGLITKMVLGDSGELQGIVTRTIYIEFFIIGAIMMMAGLNLIFFFFRKGRR